LKNVRDKKKLKQTFKHSFSSGINFKITLEINKVEAIAIEINHY